MEQRWQSPSDRIVLENGSVRLSAVQLDGDLLPLYEAASLEGNQVDLFRYHVNVPPMTDLPTFECYMRAKLAQGSEVVYKVFSKRLGCLVGCASLMNIRAEHGSVEVGSIWYCARAQRTEINTNAMYLLFCYVFDELRYRRLEWKCNNLNEASKRAALRLGFEFEGLFRKHFMSRGESRDSAWYSIIDSEWEGKKKALEEKLGRGTARP